MAALKLSAEIREDKGKSAARRYRRQGKIPAILYGEDKEPVHVLVDEHDLGIGLRGHHSVINLVIKGKPHRCIVREVQYHPLTSKVLHVDFLGIQGHDKIEMEVPIKFEGKPEGVRDGGIFNEIKRILDIAVLPENIPDQIVINVDSLKIGDAIRLKDLQSEKYEVLGDPEDVICRVEAPHVAEVEAAEAEEEEEITEPEVMAKGKEAKESEEE
ncbi:50S ribosomal protein L25 [Caldithrix abyssi]